MPWSSTRPPGTKPKYRTAEHRRARAALEREMADHGYLVCAQPVCLMADRIIRHGDQWHVGHDDTGTLVIGPVHMACNVRDGAKRGSRRSRQRLNSRRWSL